MKRCDRCNKIVLSGNLCNQCLQLAKLRCNSLNNAMNKINYDIGKGYKKLNPYFTRYRMLIDNAEQLYEMVDILQDKVEIEPKTFAEYKKNIYNMAKEMIENKKQLIYQKINETGEVVYVNDLIKLRDEMIEAKIEFKEYEELLDISEIQKFIDKTKLREKL